FKVESIAANLLNLSSGENFIWSEGRSQIRDLEVDATVTFEDLKEWKPVEIELRHFSLGTFSAKHLGCYIGAKRMEIDIDSGSIHGVHADNYTVKLPTESQKFELINETERGKGSAVINDLNLQMRAALGTAFSAGGTIYGSKIT